MGCCMRKYVHIVCKYSRSSEDLMKAINYKGELVAPGAQTNGRTVSLASLWLPWPSLLRWKLMSTLRLDARRRSRPVACVCVCGLTVLADRLWSAATACDNPIECEALYKLCICVHVSCLCKARERARGGGWLVCSALYAENNNRMCVCCTGCRIHVVFNCGLSRIENTRHGAPQAHGHNSQARRACISG